MAIKKAFNKMICIILTCAMIATSMLSLVLVNGGKASAASYEDINGHKFVCENKDYRLYMNETDLSVVIESKKNGSFMESSISYDDGKNNKTWLGAMKSALLITMIKGNTDTRQADLLNDKVTKKVSYVKDGFDAKVYWTKYKFGMTLQVRLTEDGMTAFIPDESIIEDGKEGDKDLYQIGTISVYPYMGTSYKDDKAGYMFIPDGNGALIYLDDKEGRFASGYSSMIYGKDIGFEESVTAAKLWDKYETVTDSEQTIAPIFGVAHTDDKIAFVGVVEEGAMRATIEARPNGASVDYNRVYAKFIERKLYTQPTSNNSSAGSFHMSEIDRSHSDLKIRYIFVTGDEANYCGMANAYRNYLIENGTLEILDNGYNTRLDFLGTERENWVIGTVPVTMTTVDDIREIYKDLNGEGITDIFTIYKGWQKDGLNNVPITSYKADKKIGGTNKLTSLVKFANENGIDLFLYNDALRINPSEQNATFNIVKKINKRRFEEECTKEVYKKFMYLIPSRSEELTDKFLKSYKKSGVNNLCLAGVTNTLFSWNYSGDFYTRYDCAEQYAKMISEIDEESRLVLEQPFAYLWSNTEAFLDMPLYTSNYAYEDDFIPFLSIVLKGVVPVYSEYVNFEANKKEFFLKMVETGTYPSFYLTKENSSALLYTNSSDVYSSEYEVYRDTVISYHNELKAVNEKTAGAFIVGHEIKDNKVTVVTYSNGVTIIINYSDSEQTVNGITVPAMSYKVGD